MKLIVDVSSVVKRCLFVGEDKENGRKVLHEGKPVQVNSAIYGYDNAINSTVACFKTLNVSPSDTLLVYETGATKARRQAIYPSYKLKKTETAPEIHAEVVEAIKMYLTALRAAGATAMTQPNVEADDAIAYLATMTPGRKVIFSEDGDLAQLIDANTWMYRQGSVLNSNPYGPFAIRHIRLYKALVGDPSDGYKGAVGFGEKAWLDLLAGFDESDLDALEAMIQKGLLHELAEDVAGFKPFGKIVEGAGHVYQSYALAGLRPEWANTAAAPLHILPIEDLPVEDYRLRTYTLDEAAIAQRDAVERTLAADIASQLEGAKRARVVFDVEIIGTGRPVFLVCTMNVDTGEKRAYWWHRSGDMEKLLAELRRNDLTWVSFNGINFDAPLISAAVAGHDPKVLKYMTKLIIPDDGGKGLPPWQLEEKVAFTNLQFDHIDLVEPAPGVRISLKTYAGRMGYPTMVDMPFHHDKDLTEAECQIVEDYCFNDIGVTIELLNRLQTEIELREQMSRQYGIDVRSKSDAQVAEAVLRQALGIRGRVERQVPKTVRYTAPAFIQTDSPVIRGVLDQLQSAEFAINRANGQVIAPDFLADPVKLGYGTYQMGVGGLHSTHDVQLHVKAGNGRQLSDFDVASYYPNIMLKAGLIPDLDGHGEQFITEYQKIYDRRIAAKRAGDKKVANSLKITLNGTFGKLGSVYSAFYAPELMLAVTLTGQLNLMCLIHDLEKLSDVRVISANTDGLMVDFPDAQRDAVLAVVAANAERTGFEYEETPYSQVALKDVNNYIAVTLDGKAKRKGLYAETSLMKNPTMVVCSNMAVDFLVRGTHPQQALRTYKDMRDFVAIRAVKGGGVQPDRVALVDDWVLVQDNGDKTNLWMRQAWLDEGLDLDKAQMRKSRPKPVEVYEGGTPFGRVARWYMTTAQIPPTTYVGSGNKVPKTEGAKVCMTLPDAIPADLDKGWYIRETLSILENLGVTVDEEETV